MELRATFNIKQGKLNKVLRPKLFVYVYDTQDRDLQYTCHLAGETNTAWTGRARAHGCKVGVQPDCPICPRSKLRGRNEKRLQKWPAAVTDRRLTAVLKAHKEESAMYYIHTLSNSSKGPTKPSELSFV